MKLICTSVLLFFSLAFVSSCKKTSQVSFITQKSEFISGSDGGGSSACTMEDPVTYYSEKLVDDSLFWTFINGIVNNSHSIYQNIHDQTGNRTNFNAFVSSYNAISPNNNSATLQLLLNNNIDTALVVSNLSASITDGVYFYDKNQCFFQLTDQQIKQILSNVLSDPRCTSKLTWGEFTTCAVESIAGFIIGYGGIIGQVYNLLTQGPAYLAWGDVFSIAKSIVRQSVPWWAVVGTAIQFGACLWNAW